MELSILDIYGRTTGVLKSFYQSTGEYLEPIHISHLATGIYFFQIKTEQGMVVKKIIKE